MANIAPSDHDLAQCIGPATRAPAQNSDAALAALASLVSSFAPTDAAQADLLTQYLLKPELDVYLGYLAPQTIQ